MDSDIRYIRKFIAVYEIKNKKRIWKADFFSDKDALKYIKDQAPELQPKLQLYEGCIYTETEKPLINRENIRVEASYFIETNEAINKILIGDTGA